MPRRLLGNLVTLLGVSIWSTSFIATEMLLETWHPLLLPPARLGLASLTLVLFLILMGRVGELRNAPWLRALKIGGLGLGTATILLILGQAYSDPVTVAIITTANPLVAAVMGFLVGDDRPTPLVAIGVIVAVCGAAAASLSAASEGPGFRGGEILVLISCVFFIWFTRGSVRELTGLSDIAKAALGLGSAAIVVAPIVLLVGAVGLVDLHYDLSPKSLGTVLWMGSVSVGCSMVCWLAGCRLLESVTVASIHQNTVSFWVMIGAVVIGGQVFQGQIWGALLVVAGALLAQIRPRRT